MNMIPFIKHILVTLVVWNDKFVQIPWQTRVLRYHSPGSIYIFLPPAVVVTFIIMFRPYAFNQSCTSENLPRYAWRWRLISCFGEIFQPWKFRLLSVSVEESALGKIFILTFRRSSERLLYLKVNLWFFRARDKEKSRRPSIDQRFSTGKNVPPHVLKMISLISTNSLGNVGVAIFIECCFCFGHSQYRMFSILQQRTSESIHWRPKSDCNRWAAAPIDGPRRSADTDERDLILKQ